MTLTAAEQFGIELINRARLDPLGEARRYGISLNDDLAAGTISGTPKQVLAPNSVVALAAERHANWILSTDNFSHTGAGGSDPGQRITAAGYKFSGTWSWGENLAYSSLGGSLNANSVIASHHSALFHSAGHRENILRDSYREIGYSQQIGNFQGSNGSVVAENFASRSADKFVTGVAYDDRNNNNFYSIGEGDGGIRIAQTGGAAVKTAAAGGYGLRVESGSSVSVELGSAGSIAKLFVNTNAGNVKVDLVNGDELWIAGHARLVSGINDATLLGVANYNLTGSRSGDALTGNAGNNRIGGGTGSDTILGNAGKDALYGSTGNDLLNSGTGNDLARGGSGNDRVLGAGGNDRLFGDTGRDYLSGGSGNDTIAGGRGLDKLYGGTGTDHFDFNKGDGYDILYDMKAGQRDVLELDHTLWSGNLTARQVVEKFAIDKASGIVLDFGADAIAVLHVTDHRALAAMIDIV